MYIRLLKEGWKEKAMEERVVSLQCFLYGSRANKSYDSLLHKKRLIRGLRVVPKEYSLWDVDLFIVLIVRGI